MRAFDPVPSSTTAVIICASAAAVCGLTATPTSSGSVVESTDRSGPPTSRTRYGFISTPRLATAATTIAIWRGVARTSN